MHTMSMPSAASPSASVTHDSSADIVDSTHRFHTMAAETPSSSLSDGSVFAPSQVTDSSGTVYSWTMKPVINSMLPVLASSGSSLTLPPFTLAAAVNYTFTSAIYYASSGPALTTYTDTWIQLPRSGLNATIVGGSNSLRVIDSADEKIVIDASASRDPDFNPAADSPIINQFTFKWTIEPTDGLSADTLAQFKSNMPTLTFVRSQLPPNVYTVNVVMIDNSYGRTQSTTQIMTIRDSAKLQAIDDAAAKSVKTPSSAPFFSGVRAALIIVLPLLAIVLIIALCYLCAVQRRRKAKQAQAAMDHKQLDHVVPVNAAMLTRDEAHPQPIKTLSQSNLKLKAGTSSPKSRMSLKQRTSVVAPSVESTPDLMSASESEANSTDGHLHHQCKRLSLT